MPRLVRLLSPLLLRELAAPLLVYPSQAQSLLPALVHLSQALLLLPVPQPSLALPHLKVSHLSLSLALLLQVALRPNLFRAHSLNLPQAHPLSQLQALLPSQPRALSLNLLPNLLLSQLQFQALPPNPPRVLPPSQPLLRLALLNPLARMPHPALSAPLDPWHHLQAPVYHPPAPSLHRRVPPPLRLLPPPHLLWQFPTSLSRLATLLPTERPPLNVLMSQALSTLSPVVQHMLVRPLTPLRSLSTTMATRSALVTAP